MMGNRSDRRFANLFCTRALEAVELIRPGRADFHQGQEHLHLLYFKAEYMVQPITSIPTNDYSPGVGSIYGTKHRAGQTQHQLCARRNATIENSWTIGRQGAELKPTYRKRLGIPSTLRAQDSRLASVNRREQYFYQSE
jgi:hypothetical protein